MARVRAFEKAGDFSSRGRDLPPHQVGDVPVFGSMGASFTRSHVSPFYLAPVKDRPGTGDVRVCYPVPGADDPTPPESFFRNAVVEDDPVCSRGKLSDEIPDFPGAVSWGRWGNPMEGNLVLCK